uniref:Uncharacterized protein n=1 Tax=Magnetospirillum gryphiswaldense TaxID=55518 RepID=A4TVZ9_9PROT|nr:hypothetical protein MGR_1784 [Magnetospirillum gryphiswaldense MSR-1]
MEKTLDREMDWNQVNTHISYTNVLVTLVTLPKNISLVLALASRIINA